MLKLGGFVVLCLCIPAILCMSEEMEELAKQLHNDCQAQTGVAEAIIDELKEKRGFPDDGALKCYLKCLMTEMAVVDDDGVIDIEAALAVLPDDIREVTETTIRNCGIKKGADPCDSVYLFHKCWYDTDPKNYFIV